MHLYIYIYIYIYICALQVAVKSQNLKMVRVRVGTAYDTPGRVSGWGGGYGRRVVVVVVVRAPCRGVLIHCCMYGRAYCIHGRGLEAAARLFWMSLLMGGWGAGPRPKPPVPPIGVPL